MTNTPTGLGRRAFLRGAAALCAENAHATPVGGGPATYKRNDPSYEALRRSLIWQAIKPARYPDRIVEVASVADVVAALASARADGRRVSMVSCGHNYVGTGIRDGTTLLHLGNLQGVAINKGTRTAALQPGVRAYLLDSLLEKQHLAFPVPHNPTVGLAGFLLGGGMGWNAESWNNLACFNLRSVEAVLASGEIITADEQHHSDLFWAARGGGPYFPAVATRFHVDVFARPAAIRESTLVYSCDAAPDVITWLDKVHPSLDPKMEVVLIFGTSDPEDNNGKAEKQCIASLVCFADSDGEAKRIYQTVANVAPKRGLVFKEELKPMTIGGLLLEDKASLPNRHAVETVWTNRPAETAQKLAELFQSAPTSTTLLYQNYRARPIIPADGAYSVMGSAFVFSDVSWDNEKDDTANRAWSDQFVSSLAGLDIGAYINESEIVRYPDRAMHCYSKTNWERLRQVVAKYDPQRVFVSPLNP